MPAVKVLARGWKIEIKEGAAYVEVKGLTSLTFDGEKNDVDTTSFDDNGATSHMVGSRSKSLSMEGYFLEDQTDKSRDPGQEAVEALAEKVGKDSLGIFKRTSPAGTVRYFRASANVSGVGGGNDDPTGWSAELTVSGPISAVEIN